MATSPMRSRGLGEWVELVENRLKWVTIQIRHISYAWEAKKNPGLEQKILLPSARHLEEGRGRPFLSC